MQADAGPRRINSLFPIGEFARRRAFVVMQAALLAAGGAVAAAPVIQQHALGVEARNQRLHRRLRHLHTLLGIAVDVALVVERNALYLEDVEQFVAILAFAE